MPTSWSIVGQRDFNGDGNADMLWRDTNGDLAMWFMNGTQVLSGAGLGNVPSQLVDCGTGDFNGDGKAEIALARHQRRRGDLVHERRAAPLRAGSRQCAHQLVDRRNRRLQRRRQDRHPVARHGGDVAIWFMNGTQVVSTPGLGNVPTSWSIVGTGDFNGDGKTDILWRDTDGDVAIWFMNGTQVVSSSDLGNVPTNWSIAETGDFNGDGKSDILWRDTPAARRRGDLVHERHAVVFGPDSAMCPPAGRSKGVNAD